MANETFDRARTAFNLAAADPTVTVGHTIDFGEPISFAGNLHTGDALLSPLLVDEAGRFWKEVHQNGQNGLVCVLDMRQLVTAIDAGPIGFPADDLYRALERKAMAEPREII